VQLHQHNLDTNISNDWIPNKKIRSNEHESLVYGFGFLTRMLDSWVFEKQFN